MFINGHEIEKRSDLFFPAPELFEPRNVKEACYDLRIGNEVFLPDQRLPVRLSDENPFVILPPGRFALIKTYEQVFVPRGYLALISIRSRYRFQGLINISGFHVDPTYRGHLIFSVQNGGPNDIRLEFKQAAFMIMWAGLRSPYLGPEREKGYDRIPLELMAQLGGPSATLASLQRRIEEMSSSLKIYGGFAIAAFLALLGLLLKVIFHG